MLDFEVKLRHPNLLLVPSKSLMLQVVIIDTFIAEEITSLCMNCQENGTTRFLFTKIPFFKEIIVSSFQCEHCGLRNNEVSFGGQLADFGVRYELKVINSVQMNRNVVKSENAIIRIPELDLEIPPQT
jgi:zinc finger protein